MIRAGILTWALVVALAAPATAHAHLVTSGLGPYYDGALHLLLSPGGVLCVIGAALLAGLRGATASRLLVIALASSWLIAGWIGLDRPGELPDPAWLSAASFLVLGVLVAADARMPPVAVAALGGAVGALHGLTDGSALAALGAGFSALLGTVTAVVMLALFTAAAVVPLRALWTRIVVRVAGSWLGAVGVLMLGWLAQGTA